MFLCIGVIPPSIEGLTNLQTLNLSGSGLTGMSVISCVTR